MNIGGVSWDGIGAIGGITGALLAIWPLARASTKRTRLRRRLNQSLGVLREIRASGTERPSTAALCHALEEVVDECATYLTVTERNWIRGIRSMFRVVLGIAISVAAISGLVVLASMRGPVEFPIFERSIIFVVVVLLYGLAGLATIREQMIRRQRTIDARSAVYVPPAVRLNAADGPTVVLAISAPAGQAAG
jgi:hypothetical protein